ncbi:hypothetical protein FRC17_005259, partial [Serendipita sp. 399]
NQHLLKTLFHHLAPPLPRHRPPILLQPNRFPTHIIITIDVDVVRTRHIHLVHIRHRLHPKQHPLPTHAPRFHRRHGRHTLSGSRARRRRRRFQRKAI